MKLYMKCKDEFDLWDFLNLNSDIFDINFTEIQTPTDDPEDSTKTIYLKQQTVEVTLKKIKGSDKYKRQRNYRKLFETLKLFVKTHDEEDDDMD